MGSNVLGPHTETHPANKTAWGAIFGGTFVYLAIFTTFGFVLAGAVFASAGWTSLGYVIWNAVVAIISLYFAGRATAHLAAIDDNNIGMWHGIVTFGMCFFATLLVLGITILTAAPYSAAAATNAAGAVSIIGILSGGGWALWCAMVIGFGAAAWGGSQGAKANRDKNRVPAEPAGTPDIRRVA